MSDDQLGILTLHSNNLRATIMDPSTIQAGAVYTDRNDLDRYVVTIVPANGKKLARIKWRRPGMFASKIETETIAAFARAIRERNDAVNVEFAPELSEGGMAK